MIGMRCHTEKIQLWPQRCFFRCIYLLRPVVLCQYASLTERGEVLTLCVSRGSPECGHCGTVDSEMLLFTATTYHLGVRCDLAILIDRVYRISLWLRCTSASRLIGCFWRLSPKTQKTTLEAERQVRDFLIGPRNKKQRKKRSTIKILHPPFQITSRDF
jgi:hypothetical protein